MISAIPLAFALFIAQTQPQLVQVDASDFAVVYPVTMTTTNYYWSVQSSTDMVNWQNEPYTTSNTTYTIYMNGRNNLFFRIKGNTY